MRKIIATLAVLAILSVSSFYFFNREQIYESSKIDWNAKPVRLLFAGDMMFDRTIREIAEDKSYDYLFSCLSDYLDDVDLVAANLEGPITDYMSISRDTVPGQNGNTTFTFDKRILGSLLSHRISMVNLGNNHILDFGYFGLAQTKQFLGDNGILFFGTPAGQIYATTNIRGYDLAMINFNQFLNDGSAQETISAIWKTKKDSDLVVVYAHWGEEYSAVTDFQKALAHSFIDAGADLVIGSHPHIIQERESYKGKDIHYSLGNFIFDQYWDDKVSTGGGVEVILDGDKIEQNQVRFDIDKNGLTCLL